MSAGQAPATAGAAIGWAQVLLAAAGVASPRLDARLLLAHAIGLEPEAHLLRPGRWLGPRARARAKALIARRARREPVAKILGRREFWSLSFKVTADTLDPRPESETLVEALLDAVPDRGAPVRLLDLGTGSGCLLLAALSELPRATGLGVDIEPRAVRVARDNAGALGLAGRADFRVGDWGVGLGGPFNYILANPPYVSDAEISELEPEIARYEPRRAIAAGVDGLAAYRALAPHLARLMAPDGVALMEVGAGQAAAAASILAETGLAVRRTVKDLAGVQRCLIATPVRSRSDEQN